MDRIRFEKVRRGHYEVFAIADGRFLGDAIRGLDGAWRCCKPFSQLSEDKHRTRVGAATELYRRRDFAG